MRNPRVVFDLLFAAASSTLLDLGRDEERLGATLGLTAVLHTWTRELHYHPHLHTVVTGGGLAPGNDRWIAGRRRYLFPVKVLSRLFRGKFLAALGRAYRRGKLKVADDADFPAMLTKLYREEWVVFAKRPFGGARHVYEYLGRYTHRVAISNQRLLAVDEEGVRFLTKNGKSVNIPPLDFIRRFLLHVLPRGYVKIRHFGLMAASNATTRLEIARERLEESGAKPEDAIPSYPELCLEEFIDRPCPQCRAGRLSIHLPLESLIPVPDT